MKAILISLCALLAVDATAQTNTNNAVDAARAARNRQLLRGNTNTFPQPGIPGPTIPNPTIPAPTVNISPATNPIAAPSANLASQNTNQSVAPATNRTIAFPTIPVPGVEASATTVVTNATAVAGPP